MEASCRVTAERVVPKIRPMPVDTDWSRPYCWCHSTERISLEWKTSRRPPRRSQFRSYSTTRPVACETCYTWSDARGTIHAGSWLHRHLGPPAYLGECQVMCYRLRLDCFVIQAIHICRKLDIGQAAWTSISSTMFLDFRSCFKSSTTTIRFHILSFYQRNR